MASQPKSQETKPVLADDGRTTLGSCEVKKFRRIIGEPLKEIIVRDTEKNIVATIFVYRLHSRVHCGTLVVEGKPVDSKRAVEIARAALENSDDPEAMLAAIQDESQRLNPRRQGHRNGPE
jgi:hypothetical protein